MYKEGEQLVVYLDAIWLLNLLIDACLLKLTAFMLKRDIHWWRLWLGALFASMIVVLLFTPISFVLGGPAGKLVFSMIIILIAFGYHKASVFLQNLAAFYFSAFAIGGGLFALHYFMQNESFYANNHFLTTMNYGDPISWLFVVLGFPLLWYFSKRRINQTVIRKWNQSTLASVNITINDHVVQAKGMIDSGNKLCDPLTRQPVIFLSRDACADELPEVLFSQEQASEGTQWIETLPEDWQLRLALIPYQAVDGKKQFIWAFRPDQLTLIHEGHVYQTNRVLIAPTSHQLSSTGDFNCILHPDLLLNGKSAKTAS